MALARWQATIVDASGNIMPGAQVTVRSEATGNLVSCFADRDGVTPKANPFTADPTTAYAFAHLAGGAYRIKAVLGSQEIEWRYVAIGLAAESDVVSLPTLVLTQTEYDALDPPDASTIYYIMDDEE